MPISIYPPTLRSTQEAFLVTTSTYPVYFTLQKITSIEDVRKGHIQIRVVRQNDNSTIVNTAKYPDACIYQPASSIRESGQQYYVNIESSDLSERWQAGQLYKIQLRFGQSPLWTDRKDFATWKQQQIDQDLFSEWSNVMIVKAIQSPTVYIKNAGSLKPNVTVTEKRESSLTPLFSGYAYINPTSNELIDQYKFDLIYNDRVIESSGWKQHNSTVDSLDNHRFKTLLTAEENYTVTYDIITENGYKASSTPYEFIATLTFLPGTVDAELVVDSQDIYCKENGCINIYLDGNIELSGNYVLTRTSEKSNFRIYEDLKYLVLSKVQIRHTLVYQDFTIESGIKYKYAIQQENAAGWRTAPQYEEGVQEHLVNFEYSYLYRDGLQVRLQFNQTMNSFKHSVLRSKQDTLGDRYTHLAANGNAYYAEFPINGLITFEMDSDQTFLSRTLDGYYYKDELVLPREKFHQDLGFRDQPESAATSLTIDRNLTDDNIYIERIFREKVEGFLNSFDYKLYRSPTEGNIVVGLMNVTMQPNQTLGRMIYSFTATAYEVASPDLPSLDKVGIIDIGHYTSLATDEVFVSFGQIGPIYENGTDLYSLIEDQEAVSVGGGYRMQMTKITRIWVEQYPKLDLTADVLEQDALKSKAEILGEDTTQYDERLAELAKLQERFDGPQSTTTVLTVNSTRVVMQPNRVYSLDEKITSLRLEYAQAPIFVNYICDTIQRQDERVGIVSGIESARVWNQIAGVFTNNPNILKNYDYKYRDSPTYRVFNPIDNLPVVYDKQGDILIDNTNYNVCKTLNLYEVIKQDTQKQVEFLYNTRFRYIDGELTDGDINYMFDHIVQFDIEADSDTVVLIGKKPDGSDAKEIRIGDMSRRKAYHPDMGLIVTHINGQTRFVLNPLEFQIQYIALKQPQFCIINYTCITNQTMLTRIGADSSG